MRRAARTLGVALAAHLAFWALALATAIGAETDLRARGVDYLDAESVLELLVRDGLLNAPVKVLLAGLAAALFVTPYLEAALASAATLAVSLRAAFRGAVSLTPASLGLSLLIGLVAVAALGFASLAPISVLWLTDDVFDDRARAGYLALSVIPGALIALGYGVAVDVGRIHLARGEALLGAAGRGLRAIRSRLFVYYAVTLGVGLSASFAHAWLGRTNDASSLVAGGVILFLRPLSRAVFMLAASSREHGR